MFKCRIHELVEHDRLSFEHARAVTNYMSVDEGGGLPSNFPPFKCPANLLPKCLLPVA